MTRKKLSTNFYEDEFACKCGCCDELRNYGDYISKYLVENLQELRDLIQKEYGGGHPIYVGSGYRCSDRNRFVGGEDDSRHMLGLAVDIRCPGITVGQLYECALCIPAFRKGGIGLYNDRLHLDLGDRRRWEDFK